MKILPTREVLVIATGLKSVINEADYDPALHDELNAAPAGLDLTPGEISRVNVAEAVALVAQATTIEELAVLKDDEKSGRRGGRTSVLEAIDDRKKELKAAARAAEKSGD